MTQPAHADYLAGSGGRRPRASSVLALSLGFLVSALVRPAGASPTASPEASRIAAQDRTHDGTLVELTSGLGWATARQRPRGGGSFATRSDIRIGGTLAVGGAAVVLGGSAASLFAPAHGYPVHSMQVWLAAPFIAFYPAATSGLRLALSPGLAVVEVDGGGALAGRSLGGNVAYGFWGGSDVSLGASADVTYAHAQASGEQHPYIHLVAATLSLLLTYH